MSSSDGGNEAGAQADRPVRLSPPDAVPRALLAARRRRRRRSSRGRAHRRRSPPLPILAPPPSLRLLDHVSAPEQQRRRHARRSGRRQVCGGPAAPRLRGQFPLPRRRGDHRLARLRRARGRGLRRGCLHGRAPGAPLREVDALVAEAGVHARPHGAVSASSSASPLTLASRPLTVLVCSFSQEFLKASDGRRLRR
jgi:hypothetical protein